MIHRHLIGGKHTNRDNIRKGKPKDEYEKIDNEFDALVKEGYFILKTKKDGLHVSINPRRLEEILGQLDTIDNDN